MENKIKKLNLTPGEGGGPVDESDKDRAENGFRGIYNDYWLNSPIETIPILYKALENARTEPTRLSLVTELELLIGSTEQCHWIIDLGEQQKAVDFWVDFFSNLDATIEEVFVENHLEYSLLKIKIEHKAFPGGIRFTSQPNGNLNEEKTVRENS